MAQLTAQLTATIEELLATDVADILDPDRGPRLRALYDAHNRLAAAISRELAVFDGRGLSVADAAPSTQSWLRGRANLTTSEASEQVHLARGLRDFEATAAAWQRGEITREHARAITLLAK